MRDNLDKSVNAVHAANMNGNTEPSLREQEGVTTMLGAETLLADPGPELPGKI